MTEQPGMASFGAGRGWLCINSVVLRAVRFPFRQIKHLLELLKGSICESSESTALEPARPGSSPKHTRGGLHACSTAHRGENRAGVLRSLLAGSPLPVSPQQLSSSRRGSSTPTPAPRPSLRGLQGLPAISASGSAPAAPLPSHPPSSGPPRPLFAGAGRAEGGGDEGRKLMCPAGIPLPRPTGVGGGRKWLYPPPRLPTAPSALPPPAAALPLSAHPSGEDAEPRRSIKGPPGR